MKQCLIVGVDVSKKTLDMCFKPSGLQLQISNDLPGFKQWFKILKQQRSIDNEVLVIMEHTGPYSFQFELFLRKSAIPYCKLCALEIKRSLGMLRGKNDKVDAVRIASYGWMRRDTLTADEYPIEAIERLRDLLSLRSKLVQDRSGYMCRIKELRACRKLAKSDLLLKMQAHIIDELTSTIAVVEKQIKQLLQSDKKLQKTFLLLQSIKGVGLVVGAYMIAWTENFRRFANARKFNCYSGLAPFSHQSGSSIHARSRLSHLANKEAKTLLGLAATCAMQYDPELKQYYLRRQAEGKLKQSCINIIKAKIVARMFAVVKRQTPYQQLSIAA